MEDAEFENWEQKKDFIKKEYPQIAEKDLYYEVGKEEEVLEQLQKKLNKTKKEIRDWLSFLG